MTDQPGAHNQQVHIAEEYVTVFLGSLGRILCRPGSSVTIHAQDEGGVLAFVITDAEVVIPLHWMVGYKPVVEQVESAVGAALSRIVAEMRRP